MPKTTAEIEALDRRVTEAVDALDSDAIRKLLISITIQVESDVLDEEDGANTAAVIWDILKDACLTFNTCWSCQARTTTGDRCEACAEAERQ